MQDIKTLLQGIISCVSEKELLLRCNEKKILNVKYGADPTKPDLHLGHYVCLQKLKDFQEQGHKIIFIIGDFTAMIGDPSGRQKTRPRLSEREVKENAKTYMEQVYKVLDPRRTETVFNSEWLSCLNAKDIIQLASSYTIARMLERNDFNERMRKQNPISIHEFLYPLFQAYDSVHLNIDVEIGGHDQYFNFALTREIQKAYGQKPQIFITLPVIEGTDGKKKMSKTEGNAIGLTEPADEIFGKVMSIPDSLLSKYYYAILRKKGSKIEKEIKENPRDAKENLAFEIVKNLYNEKSAIASREKFHKLFVDKEIPEKIQDFFVLKEKSIVDIIFETGLVASKSEARRLIRQGAVKLNNEPIRDEFFKFKKEDSGILKIGKRRFVKIAIK